MGWKELETFKYADVYMGLELSTDLVGSVQIGNGWDRYYTQADRASWEESLESTISRNMVERKSAKEIKQQHPEKKSREKYLRKSRKCLGRRKEKH